MADIFPSLPLVFMPRESHRLSPNCLIPEEQGSLPCQNGSSIPVCDIGYTLYLGVFIWTHLMWSFNPLALLNDLSSSSTFGAFQFSNTANFKSLACAHFVIPLNWSAIMNVNGLGLSTILTTSYLIPGHRFSYWSGQPIVTLFEVFRCFYFVLFLFFLPFATAALWSCCSPGSSIVSLLAILIYQDRSFC